MITDVGPGIVPCQFALIQEPPSNTLAWWYWSTSYVMRQRLQAAGWDRSDPVFYAQCNDARPQGAMEFSWLSRQVLQSNVLNPTLPRIPRNQVRYLSARQYAVLTDSTAKILSAAMTTISLATSGASVGVGLTHYGPVDLPLELELTDVQGRREHYAVALRIEGPEAFDLLAQQHPQSPLRNHLQYFSVGGVTFHLTYKSLGSRRTKQINVIFPIQILRHLLGAENRAVFAKGRLAALV